MISVSTAKRPTGTDSARVDADEERIGLVLSNQVVVMGCHGL